MEDTNLSASTHQLLTKQQWNSKEYNEDWATGLQSINSTFWNMLVFYFKGECFQFPVCATPFQVFSSHISLASLWKAVSNFCANSGQSASKQALSLQPISPINNSHSPTVWETFFSRDWRLSGAQILLALQLLLVLNIWQKQVIYLVFLLVSGKPEVISPSNMHPSIPTTHVPRSTSILPPFPVSLGEHRDLI